MRLLYATVYTHAHGGMQLYTQETMTCHRRSPRPPPPSVRNLLTVASRCAAVRSACSTSARSPSYTSAWKSCIASSSAPGGGGGSGGGGLVAAATSLVGGDGGYAARQRTAQQPRRQRHVLHHDLLQRESTSEEQSVIKAHKRAGRGRGGART